MSWGLKHRVGFQAEKEEEDLLWCKTNYSMLKLICCHRD
jgi:hypothetical protein